MVWYMRVVATSMKVMKYRGKFPKEGTKPNIYR